MHLLARSNPNAGTILAMGVLALGLARPIRAETPDQTCDRLAADTVSLESMDGGAALTACSTAVAAAPADSKLQYEYARALERSGKADQAKQLYQWLAGDNFAPATTALARLAAPVTGAAADRELDARKLEAISSIASLIAQAIPRNHEDPGTVLEQTGKDPAQILAWVKTHTRLIPYAGMLRDAPGVLMDRAGNSLDRALFLADLLHRAGYNVRLARAKISPQAATGLLARIKSSIPKSTPPPPPDKETILKMLGQDPLLDPKLNMQAYDTLIAQTQKNATAANEVYNKVLPAVLQGVGGESAGDASLAAEAGEVLLDHFWVQLQAGTTWQDLDPDADVVGLPSAAAVLLPSEVPSNLKHRVTLKIILETRTNGKFAETTLLQQSWSPSEVATQSITVSHTLFPQPNLDAILMSKNIERDYLDAITSATVVMPTLQIGNRVIQGQIYNFSGQTQPPSAENVASMGGAAILSGNKLAKGLASAFGDDTQAPAANNGSQSVVSAEWLEIDIFVPGRPLETHRRAVFDLIGAPARANMAGASMPVIDISMQQSRALALSGTVDAFIFGATPAIEWIDRMSALGLNRTMTRAVLAIRKRQLPSDMINAPTEARTELALWNWAAARTNTFGVEQASPSAPGVALLWRTVSYEANGSAVGHSAFDIIGNETRGSSFTSNVRQGVVDTVLERYGVPGSTANGNSASLMANDLSAGTAWTRIDSQHQDAFASVKVDAGIRSLISADVARGELALIRPASAGEADLWWRVDPKTGRTLGIGRDERGTSMAEWTNIILRVSLPCVCIVTNGISASRSMDTGSLSPGYGIRMAGCLIGGIAGNISTAGMAAAEALNLSNAGMAVSIGSMVGPVIVHR